MVLIIGRGLRRGLISSFPSADIDHFVPLPQRIPPPSGQCQKRSDRRSVPAVARIDHVRQERCELCDAIQIDA
jgi:hypothetical protein